jgi:hypothetical protein
MNLVQAAQIKQHEVESKIIDMEKDRCLKGSNLNDDKKFNQLCKAEIEKYKQAGKPLFPLYVALEHGEPDLLAVSGFRI